MSQRCAFACSRMMERGSKIQSRSFVQHRRFHPSIHPPHQFTPFLAAFSLFLILHRPWSHFHSVASIFRPSCVRRRIAWSHPHPSPSRPSSSCLSSPLLLLLSVHDACSPLPPKQFFFVSEAEQQTVVCRGLTAWSAGCGPGVACVALEQNSRCASHRISTSRSTARSKGEQHLSLEAAQSLYYLAPSDRLWTSPLSSVAQHSDWHSHVTF